MAKRLTQEILATVAADEVSHMTSRERLADWTVDLLHSISKDSLTDPDDLVGTETVHFLIARPFNF